MIFKIKKNWKDLANSHHHHSESNPSKSSQASHLTQFSRRDFLGRGLTTGGMILALDYLSTGEFIKKAVAATLNCPVPVRNPGAIGQFFAEGGPTMGARFIGDAQAASMNDSMASNYGISGQANLQKLGPNLVIDKTSPFGFTLLQGPPGYPGGPAGWQANVLKKLSAGAHTGPFNQDDDNGVNTGLLGGVSSFKSSLMGKDLRIGASNKPAVWADGLPSSSVGRGGLSPASFSKLFSLTPAATGLTNTQALQAASSTAIALSQAMAGVLGTDVRKGSSQLANSAGCAFAPNAALADPNYGANLFDPTKVSALTAKMTVGSLSTSEQALVAAFYQSAMGVAGGVIIEVGGRDYHGNDPGDIAPKDIEDARALVMFLAGCDAAQEKGAYIYLSNGQAIAEGVQATTATINGNSVSLNTPIAKDDAGGAYNAGLIIFYDPKGAPPTAKFTGTLDTTNGNAKTDGAVGSSQEAVAGLYLSALSWINGGTIPQVAIDKMQSFGLAKNISKIVLI